MHLIYREEGIGLHGLFKGYKGTVLREGSFSTLRLGFYEPIKKVLGETDSATTPTWIRYMASSLSGLMASILANPVDMLKV